MMRAN